MNYIVECEDSSIEISEEELLKLPITEISSNVFRILYKENNFIFSLENISMQLNEITLKRNKKIKKIIIQNQL